MDYKELSQTVFEILKSVFLIFYSLLAYLVRLVLPRARKNLTGKVALVTGSANGVGEQICLQLAPLGVKLVCWDIEKDKNEKFIQTLRDQGYSAWSYHVDISDPKQIEETSKKVVHDVGPVSIVINNAGIIPTEPFLASKHPSVKKTFDINVISHFEIIRQFLPQMIKDNDGSIVSVCSFVGLVANAYFTLYCATKFAVNGYMDALRFELAQTAPNVQLMTVYPIQIATRAASSFRANLRFPSLTPVLTPSYIAQRIVEGLQKGDQYVYCPRHSHLFTSIVSLLPFETLRRMQNFVMPEFGPTGDETYVR